MAEEKNPFEKEDTTTRLQALTDQGYVIVVTRAFGPNGEDLIAHDGPQFSGEPGIKIHVKQGDLEEDVVLSPYYGDPSKIFDQPFEEGVPCELTVPETGASLDKLPFTAENGGRYYAIYLTEKLADGELVAVNDIWGNHRSRLLSEGDLLELAAGSEVEDETA